MTRKHRFFVATACMLSLPVTLNAEVTIPNSFTTGAPAVAGEVNQNFQTLADAINTLESSTGGGSSLPAVGASFQIPRGTGENKFGVLLAQENSDGTPPNCWQARVFYQNTQSEIITNAAGTPVTPDNIYRTARGCEGQTSLDWDYTYGIPNSQVGSMNPFAVTDGVEISNRYAPADGGSFNYRIEQTVVTSGGVDTVYEVAIYEDNAGELEWINDLTHIRKPIGPMTLGTPDGGSQTFDNVATQTIYGAKRLVILAEGFGKVATIDTGAVNFPTDPQFPGAETSIRSFAFARNADGEFGQLPAPFANGGAFSEFFFD